MAEDNILKFEHLSKSFGRNRVLNDINLSVRRGTIMGLMGENGAGKSTMMKCLFGIYSKDRGTIYLDGHPIDFSGPKEALENGVAMVHQELNQCLDRTISDNLFLGRYPTTFGMVNEKLISAKCKTLFRSLKMDFNPKTIMRTMSVSERQMVEIARAISYNAKIIVLDEPTSSLSEKEIKKLFELMKEVKKKGVSFIFISHKMDEVFEVCDDVAVLRDGQLIMTKKVEDTSMNELIKAMIGRSLDQRFPSLTNHPGEEVLKVEGICTKYSPHLKDITFSVKKGEIFGIYGLVGAGRSELLEAIFGLRTISAGKIVYQGRSLHFTNSKDAMEHGFALITEERKLNGMFSKADLTFNTTITNLDKYRNLGALSFKKMKDATKQEIKVMNTKCMGENDLITSLSGGNQQKVVISKRIERSPDVFLMDEPTRGIDVLAKYQIYELMNKMASEGKIIVMVSSEMPEILGVTNRIAVMSNHRLAGIVETKQTNQEELLRLCAKYL